MKLTNFLPFFFLVVAAAWSISAVRASDPSTSPYLWSDTNGEIVEVAASEKVVRAIVKEKNNSKIVSLKVTPATVLAKEYEVPASQLQAGDKVLWFSHTSYAIATGKERRRVSRTFGTSSPDDFHPKGTRYSRSFTLYMDRKRPATVSTLKPITIKFLDSASSLLTSLNYPIDESDYYRKKYSNVGILAVPKPSESYSPTAAQQPSIFTFLETSGAKFCIYQVLKLSELRAGQKIRFVTSKQNAEQAERISVTNVPS